MNQEQKDALKLVADFARGYVNRQAGRSAGVHHALYLRQLKLASDYILDELIPMRSLDLGEVLMACSEWAFGVEEFQPIDPQRIFSHLEEEVGELKQNPASGEEMADVAMLLHHLAVFYGIDLRQELERKLAINRGRVWMRRADDSHTKHVEETASALDSEV